MRNAGAAENEMKASDSSLFIRKFNLCFIAIALIGLEFCRVLFRDIEQKIYCCLGDTFSPYTMFCRLQCRTVEEHPIVYAIGCAAYYAASVKAFKSDVSTIINAILLFYCAAILLGLSGPLVRESAPW